MVETGRIITKPILAAQCQSLQNCFGDRSYSSEQINYLYLSLKGKREVHLARAVKYLANNKYRLPHNGEIILAVQDEELRDWQTKKMEEKAQCGELFDKPQKTKMATRSLALIYQIIDHQISREEAFNEIDQLARDYPGINWKAAKWGETKPQLTVVK